MDRPISSFLVSGGILYIISLFLDPNGTLNVAQILIVFGTLFMGIFLGMFLNES